MRIAMPVTNGKLSMHFGHCREFALVDVDDASGEVRAVSLVDAPDHAPGVLPRWLGEQGVTVVIAGGMGRRAIDLFAQQGIAVTVGAQSDDPEAIARAYVEKTLTTGDNVCDH